MKKSSSTPKISEAQRKEIIETASRIAIEQYHKEADRAKKAAKNKRLHNTELLMKNYRKFVIHSESAIYDASQVDDDLDLDTLLDIMDCGGIGKAPSVRSVGERGKDPTPHPPCRYHAQLLRDRLPEVQEAGGRP